MICDQLQQYQGDSVERQKNTNKMKITVKNVQKNTKVFAQIAVKQSKRKLRSVGLVKCP
jgi:hypothetical protein